MKNLLIATLALCFGVPAFAVDNPDPALIKQGEYLARAGDCVACHTAKDGKPFAGGLPMETPIGTIYSTNITPDKTGIAAYSFEDFDNAVRQGVAKSGSTGCGTAGSPGVGRSIADPVDPTARFPNRRFSDGRHLHVHR